MSLIKYDTQMEVLGSEHSTTLFSVVRFFVESRLVGRSLTLLRYGLRSLEGLVVVQRGGESQCYVVLCVASGLKAISNDRVRKLQRGMWRGILRTACMTMNEGNHLSGDRY